MDLNDLVKNKTHKRGRPRKIIEISTAHNDHMDAEEEDVILHFPISSKRPNTPRERENNVISNKFEQLDGTHTTMDDEILSLEDSDTNSEDESHISITDLKKIIAEKDELIASLKEISNTTESVKDDDTSCGSKIHMLNTPFEKNKDGTIIVPEKTDKVCLFCTYEINGKPYFLPENFINGKFSVVGWVFCSENCACAYNLNLNDSKINERYGLLKLLYNIDTDKIIPAPPIRMLQKFGGSMNIKEYRDASKILKKDFIVINYPMTFIDFTIEERINKIIKIKREKKNTILDNLKKKT